ncbi:hypothetical protein OIU76_028305 [Salix suchowensis]|nr:hypothetical protein OIU76_028305 [Salix suchowensis]
MKRKERQSCKKARDLLYKDYQTNYKFTLTTFTPTGVTITSSGTKKGEFLATDVNTQLKNKNITTDIKVDTSSNLFTTITVDEAAPGLKTIFSFKVPDQRSGKVKVQYLHDYAAVSSSVGLTVNPTDNFSGVIGTNVASLGICRLTSSNAMLELSLSKVELIASFTL